MNPKIIKFAIVLLGICIVPRVIFAGTRILLINTNASVEKYKLAQEEFKNTVSHRVVDVDMTDENQIVSHIKGLIYKEEPELIYCIGTKAYLVASKCAGQRKIVFSSVINWMRLPLTPNSYGVSNELSAEMEIMLFRYIFPKVSHIGVLYSEYTEEWFKKTRDETRTMGVEIIGQKISDIKQTIPALKIILSQTDAVWMISDPVILGDKKNPLNILRICDSAKIPVFSYHDIFAKYGAVLIVSVDTPTIGRQAAGIATELLSGNTPEEKVQFPAGSSITLNLKKVKAYGMRYSEDALGSVNSIID